MYVGLALDPKDWNSRFLMTGGGSWDTGGKGEILAPVLEGYASSSTDGGHGVTAAVAHCALTKTGIPISTGPMCRTFHLWPLRRQRFLGGEPQSYTTDRRPNTLIGMIALLVVGKVMLWHSRILKFSMALWVAHGELTGTSLHPLASGVPVKVQLVGK